ncbi:MAG: hypothetical protein O7B99_01380 [Planctomycetota bacterium]|nr:hypothetical protein [Planctomycetota bacterium]
MLIGSLRATVLVGSAVVAGYLVLVLATDELGVGERKDGGARWPYLLEDSYDVFNYQKRGRWAASDGRPYVDEFSEYPQISTWLMGLPWLLVDHGAESGEPFTSRRAVRDLLERAGAKAADVQRLFDEIDATARPEAEGAPTATLETAVQLIAPRVVEEESEVLRTLRQAWTKTRAREVDLRAVQPSYQGLHYTIAALFYVALLALLATNLRRLGHAPAWALLMLLPGSLYFAFNRFDMAVTVLVALALFFQIRERPFPAAAVLGLAIMTKWAPLVLVPLFLAHNFARARAGEADARSALRDAVLKPGLITAAVIVSVLATTFVWGGGGWAAVWELPRWHLEERKPNHASLLSLLTSERAWSLLPSSAAPALDKVFKVLQLLPGLALAFFPMRSVTRLVLGCLVATTSMVIFSEFFSPQWVIWITALAILVVPRLRWLLLPVVVLELVMYLQLPVFHHHAQATGEFGGFEVVTTVRAIWMLLFLAAAIVAFVRSSNALPTSAAEPLAQT